MQVIRGLTLYRPWDVAMRELGKGIENRDWKPPAYLIGGYLALHSGQHWDAAGAETIAEITGRTLQEHLCPSGYITCVGKLTGYVEVDDWGRPLFGGATVPAGMEQWLFGRYGWIVEERIAIEPVPCKGAMGLWRLADTVLAQVMQHYEAARSAS